LSEITNQELQTWKTGKFKYGLFIRESIPFLLIDFGDGFNFDCSFNIYKVKQEYSSAWLESKANLVNLFLVDRNSYTTKAMRATGLQLAFMDELKAALTEQHKKYNSKDSVDVIIKQCEAKFTIDAMLKRSQLYQFG